MSTIENEHNTDEDYVSIVSTPDQPKRKSRNWLIPVCAGAAVLLSTGAGYAATHHDKGMVAPMVSAMHKHEHAVAQAAAAKAKAKATKWAHDMHNPRVLEASVKDSYAADLDTTDGASIDHVTCQVKDTANPDMFSCLISAVTIYSDDPITAAHDVLVSHDGSTWQATS